MSFKAIVKKVYAKLMAPLARPIFAHREYFKQSHRGSPDTVTYYIDLRYGSCGFIADVCFLKFL